MSFTKINMDTFPRREHYEHYAKNNHCTYSLNERINIKPLIDKTKLENKHFYAMMIAVVSKAVNSFKECRMAVDEEGNLGYYDKVSPSYTIFHDDDKTFSCLYSDYNDDLEVIYNNVVNDMQKYKDTKGIFLKPENKQIFCVSTLPWSNFESLSLNVAYQNFFVPIITWGKFDSDGNISISVRANHAVMDGYHTCMLIRKIEKLCNTI